MCIHLLYCIIYLLYTCLYKSHPSFQGYRKTDYVGAETVSNKILLKFFS